MGLTYLLQRFYCNCHQVPAWQANEAKRWGVKAKNMTLFGKLADQEDGRLIITILSGSGCQNLREGQRKRERSNEKLKWKWLQSCKASPEKANLWKGCINLFSLSLSLSLFFFFFFCSYSQGGGVILSLSELNKDSLV